MRDGDVHLGELVRVEPGEFAPGLVEGVELLLLNDLRRDVAEQDDQPRLAGHGPPDRANVGLDVRLFRMARTMETDGGRIALRAPGPAGR